MSSVHCYSNNCPVIVITGSLGLCNQIILWQAEIVRRASILEFVFNPYLFYLTGRIKRFRYCWEAIQAHCLPMNKSFRDILGCAFFNVLTWLSSGVPTYVKVVTTHPLQWLHKQVTIHNLRFVRNVIENVIAQKRRLMDVFDGVVMRKKTIKCIDTV